MATQCRDLVETGATSRRPRQVVQRPYAATANTASANTLMRAGRAHITAGFSSISSEGYGQRRARRRRGPVALAPIPICQPVQCFAHVVCCLDRRHCAQVGRNLPKLGTCNEVLHVGIMTIALDEMQ